MKMRYAVIAVFLALLFFALPAYAQKVGKVSDMSGSVSWREKDGVPYKAASKGLELGKGSWLKTGKDGWAVVELEDKSRLTIANDTELELTDLVIGKGSKTGVISVTQGKLRAAVTRLAGEKVDYKVKSPTAVAGIKGTEFLMMSQGQANVFFGNEGTVEVSGEVSGDGAAAKPLGTDMMVQNTRGYTPTDPVKVEPDTPLASAKKNFQEITSAMPPADWEASGQLPNIIARWNINYGRYLADSGRYEEALYVFQIALDLTSMAEIRSDARLERGAVYARFLGNPEAALGEYLLVLEEYPYVPQRETALYLSGMTLYEMGLKGQAIERLEQYKKEYPAGKHIGNVNTFLELLNK